jgi:hypothetical protein
LQPAALQTGEEESNRVYDRSNENSQEKIRSAAQAFWKKMRPVYEVLL